MKQHDLAKFREIPGHPAYRVSETGEVLSFKRGDATALVPSGSPKNDGVWLRVTLDRYTYRLRDLVRLVWGSDYEFRVSTRSTNESDAA